MYSVDDQIWEPLTRKYFSEKISQIKVEREWKYRFRKYIQKKDFHQSFPLSKPKKKKNHP